jgi:hypothetical protein
MALILGSSIVACNSGSSGPTPPPLGANPTLSVDTNELAFGEEFGTATYLGTSAQNSFWITNQGLPALQLKSVTLSGPSAYRMVGPLDLNQNPINVLDGGEKAAVTVYFTPTALQQYYGSVTINSNDPATPSKVITLAGCGVAPDGGTTSYCQFLDAGL